jgi:DNA sulfur modification protein DndE
MTLSLLDIAKTSFRTGETADALGQKFMERLGARAKYMPARLALGRSLAVAGEPPPVTEDLGNAIRGSILFGEGPDYPAWISLLTQHSGREDVTIKELQASVAAHWQRGLQLLEEDWAASDGDLNRFERRLADSAGFASGDAPGTDGSDPDVPPQGAVRVPLGEVGVDEGTGQPYLWSPNESGGTPHLAIMGGNGSGKTRTAVAMLRNLRAFVPAPLLAFDFKGDLATFYKLEEGFDATVLTSPRAPVPLDVLYLASTDNYDIKIAADRFRDSFSRLKGNRVGDRQKDALAAAAERALTRQRPTRLSDIRDALQLEYQRRALKQDGAISLMNDLCRFPLFEPLQSPAEFFRRSWLVSLPSEVSETTKMMVVNLLLDALERHLLSQSDAAMDQEGNRAIRQICMIDEAHRILGTKMPALNALVRQSRSKGGLIMLISQSPDDFAKEEDDFLSEMGLLAAFATNAPPANAGRILGRNLDLPGLPKGIAWARRRGDAEAVRVQAFR